MEIRKKFVVGTLALSAALFPDCRITDNIPAQIEPKETLELYDPSVVLVAGNNVVIQSSDARISEDMEARASLKTKIFGQGEINLDSFTWDEARYGPIEINWFDVRAENGFYSNTVPGQSRIKYREVPVGSGWSIKPGAGTHRLKIVVNYGGRRLESANKTETKRNGTITGVNRISIREGDDLPGQMTAWGNLPYIYGSSDEQVEKFAGGDCADIIVGALHKMGRTDVPYTYSQGFGRFGKVVFDGYIDMQGNFLDRNKRLVTDLDIERGDLLVYKAPQHHVAVFYNSLQKSGDPIKVVQTYDAKGVHVDTMYAVETVESLFKQFSNLFSKPTEARRPIDTKLDTVEVLRLK